MEAYLMRQGQRDCLNDAEFFARLIRILCLELPERRKCVLLNTLVPIAQPLTMFITRDV